MKAFASSRDNAAGRAHLAPERRQQLRRAELHVVEHFGHRVALHEIGDLVRARLVQPHVHGVGVAEQVVQVAEDLLVRAGEEDAEDVVLAVAELDAARGWAAPSCRRRSDRSCRPNRRSRPAGCRAASAPRASRWIGMIGKQLVDGPAVRQRLEEREVAEVAVDQHRLELRQDVLVGVRCRPRRCDRSHSWWPATAPRPWPGRAGRARRC